MYNCQQRAIISIVTHLNVPEHKRWSLPRLFGNDEQVCVCSTRDTCLNTGIKPEYLIFTDLPFSFTIHALFITCNVGNHNVGTANSVNNLLLEATFIDIFSQYAACGSDNTSQVSNQFIDGLPPPVQIRREENMWRFWPFHRQLVDVIQ